MDLDAAVVNRLKSLLAENKKGEARNVLVNELGLSHADARGYVDRLAKFVEAKKKHGGKQADSKLVGLVFLGLGLIFTALVVFMFLHKKETLANSYLTKGIVIGFTFGGSNQIIQKPVFDKETTYTPVIAYEINGEAYQVAGGVSSTRPSYSIDEEVEIYVNTDNPFDITINSFLDKWFFVLIFGLFALIFDVIGVVVLIFKPAASQANVDMFNRDEERHISFDDFD